MLQQFIQRRRRAPIERAAPGPTAEGDGPDAAQARPLRPTDWLLGGSVATLAVVFVAGLLGLRSSTADLQEQSRNNTRDLAALKADTLDRINGIAGDLAKANQTLTDLIALRSGEGAAAKVGPQKGGEPAKEGEAKSKNGKAGAGRAAVPVVAKAVPSLPAPSKPAAKSEATHLAPITVRRKPERARERAVPRPDRAREATRATPRSPAEALREKREAVLRQLRLRRLAGRGSGPQPL